MIVVTVAGRKFGVSFSHPKLAKKPGRKTTCTIFESKNEDSGTWTSLGSSETVCSKQDHFKKATGRKIALQRILCDHDFNHAEVRCRCRKCGSHLLFTANLSKDLRTEIWRVYRGTISSHKGRSNAPGPS